MTASSHLKHLQAAKKAAQTITQTLYSIGQEIELTAERLITENSVSGKNHVASLPGQAPNADTRTLDNDIETKIDTESDNPTILVISNAPYSAHLEFGTRHMEARPFMAPALEENKGNIPKEIAAAMRKDIRSDAV